MYFAWNTEYNCNFPLKISDTQSLFTSSPKKPWHWKLPTLIPPLSLPSLSILPSPFPPPFHPLSLFRLIFFLAFEQQNRGRPMLFQLSMAYKWTVKYYFFSFCGTRYLHTKIPSCIKKDLLRYAGTFLVTSYKNSE